MVLERTQVLNEINTCILSSNIFEYDMRHANANAIKVLKGDDLYNQLLKMPKEDRNIRVGLMMKEDKKLMNDIDKLILSWRNQFIELNNIKKENIIELTKDSVLVKNIVPKISIIPDQKHVEFVTKNQEYSSYIRINNKLRILYDGMKKKIKIKGINDEYVDTSLFVKKILIPLLQALENSISIGYMKCFKGMQSCRINYINAQDINIYRELLNKNQILYKKYENEVYSDNIIPGEDDFIDKGSNYINFLLPLFKLRV